MALGGDVNRAGDAGVIGNVAIAGASVLAILVVRDLTARQETKQALIASGRLV